jgi:hypothetical protein
MTALRQGANQRVPDGGIVLYQQQLSHNTDGNRHYQWHERGQA